MAAAFAAARSARSCWACLSVSLCTFLDGGRVVSEIYYEISVKNSLKRELRE